MILDSREQTLATRGFAAVDNVLDPAELSALERAIAGVQSHLGDRTRSDDDIVLEGAGDGGWTAWQRGDRPLPGVLRSISRLHIYAPLVADLAAELGDRVVAPAVAETPTMVNTFLWAKPAVVGSAKPWHQDMAFTPRGFTERFTNVVTLWVAVSPATVANGCLEFVPGSHRQGLFPHVGDPELIDREARRPNAVEPHIEPQSLTGSPVPVPLSPGAGVLFDGYLVHRSAANHSAAARTAVSFVYGQGRV